MTDQQEGDIKRSVVEEFSVCVRFACLQCGVTIQKARYGVHNLSAGFACQQCHAYYTIQWQEPLPLIEMLEFREEKVRP